MNSIQKIQNRAARIVTKCFDFNIRSIDLIRKLKWMTVEERCIYFTSVLTYKSINGLASESFTNYFHKAGNVHTYATRFVSNENVELPKPKTNYLKRSLSYRGASCWNALPSDVKTSQSLSNFKSLYKQNLS